MWFLRSSTLYKGLCEVVWRHSGTIKVERHLVYQHGRHWELTDVNPIELVRQHGGRRSIPRVLSVREIRLLLKKLAEPYRTMVLVAACLGLRASEIVVLQWGDLNWGKAHAPGPAKRGPRPSRGHEDGSF